jgi:pimeloyl-ACP methyl ester carboxylesterase
MSTTGDTDVGRSTEVARKRFLAPAARDRDGYIADYLAGIRAWGSPACFDEARLTALAGEAFDRDFDPAGRARQAVAIAASGSRTAALHDVAVPTLVLHGSADGLIDPSGGRRTAEAIPGARFVLLDGMGHDYPPQYWDQIVELVTEHALESAPG